MLFADGIHLTPAGNRWVASYLYNATAQGWR
jgi:phospholipase/lecithinase/hemolysin